MKQCSYCGRENDAELASCRECGTELVEPSVGISQAGSPFLWNPKAAACWSLLFSPAFGAYLHARNAEALGRTEEAQSNRTWFYVSIVYLGVALVTLLIPAVPEGIFKYAAVALLLAWYLSLGKKQVMHVKENWADSYRRKPWRKPLLIAGGCLIGALIVEFIFGPP